MGRRSQGLCEHCREDARPQARVKIGLSEIGKAGKGLHGSPAEGEDFTTDRQK
jgi:hypothetical protein